MFDNALTQILGKRLAFPLHLDDRNQLAMVDGDMAVRQSIYLIVMTVPGERVLRPEFGCRIHELIFDPLNSQTFITAKRYVEEAIRRWEPRIDVEELTIDSGDVDRGEMLIYIKYKHKDRPDPRSLVFPYYLNPEG
jgi:phage baseplate assembly protein W